MITQTSHRAYKRIIHQTRESSQVRFFLVKMTGFCTRVFVFAIVVLFCFYIVCDSNDVSYDGRAIKINGERRILISGAIHYTRSTEQMWPSLIQKAKEGGLNTIETYVFWNAHEPQHRHYDFSGNLDLVKFIKTIQDAGLYAILRIGPYVCAEWNFGGFPVWLYNMPNMTFRTYNENFMHEMKVFTSLIVGMMKSESLFAPQGGPIILAQIENEYGNIMDSFGEDGKKYINWCAKFAESLSVGVPWIMCQQKHTPDNMIDTCNGHYCDQWHPSRGDLPKIWTENWAGWFSSWGDRPVHRPAEDLAFAVARFYQLRGTLQNYYMYHGGTNFGRTSGGPNIITSYDYDAPLDEYGLVNEPKWGHLKQLHSLLLAVEKILTNGDFKDATYNGNRLFQSTIFSYNGKRVCFFGNSDLKDATISFEGRQINIPAWSVGIYLDDCVTEVYNTARVQAQTSLKVKKALPLENDESTWKWRYENHENLPKRLWQGYKQDKEILDQKVISNDTSDYVWYMTSVRLNKRSPVWGKSVTLEVTATEGSVLHVFFNNKRIGTQATPRHQTTAKFEARLRPGRNTIAILSATVGLRNYGAYYERTRNGIVGPVLLTSPNHETMNLSSNTWTTKVGLEGMEKYKMFDKSRRHKWNNGAPVNREFIWYKRNFQTPSGDDPLVLDLAGMGKGMAWVNGNNLGRYWPSFYADDKGCNGCDFHGNYDHQKCYSECGKPTQRWYHVPRSFLQATGKENDLVLFEELGGNPYRTSIQTMCIEKICGSVPEGATLELSCHGKKISKIKFASFGSPHGSCGSFQRGNYDATNSLDVVKQACVGKGSCSILASEETFGDDPFGKDYKRSLAVEALC